MSENPKRKPKPLKVFAIVNAKGELTRVYRGDEPEPWMINFKASLTGKASMLLPGDRVIELTPAQPIEVFY